MGGGRRRATIAGIMTVTGAFAVLLAAPRYVEEPGFWVALAALPWLHPWIAVPVRMRRNQVFPIEKDYRPFDPEGPDVPGAIADRFRRARADLEALGFHVRGHFRRGEDARAVSGLVGVFEDARTGEVAKFIVAVTATTVSTTLAFIAKFADGTELATSDGSHLPNWPSPTWMIGQAFPAIRDASALLEAHRARLARHGGTPVPALPPSDDDLPAHLRRSSERVWETPLGLGYYVKDEAAGSYRPTWKGAYLMTWGRLWPVGPIRRALRLRRASRVLRELGLAVRATPAR